jgi:MFS transporter, DHA1 family, multidrug resistance protein
LNRKVFAILFFALFSTITGVGIVVPLLPIYAHSMGAAGIYIGLIFGAFSISRTFFLPFFGRWSDRKGRKPFIVTGLLAYSIVSVAFILSAHVTHLIVIRFLQGIASAMIMPVVQAYVGDITPPGREGFMMGVFNMSLFLGLSLGPVAGGLINDWIGMNATFAGMGILSLIGFFLCLTLLPPTREEAVVHRRRPPVRWQVILRDRLIAGLFVHRLVYTTGIGVIWGFLPLMASAELHLSSAQIGTLVMLGVFVSGVMQLPMGKAADSLNRKVLVAVGGLISGSALLGYQHAYSYEYLFAVSVLFGLGGGIAMPALMAIGVSEGHRTGSMGTVIALLTMAHSIGMFLGSLGAGLMMDLFHLRVAFFASGLMMFAGVAVFLICSWGIDTADRDNLQRS